MRVAITAASGGLGGAIIRQLIPILGKENVLALARSPEKAQHLGVAVKRADYNNRDDFQTALSGIDVVLIVSGMDSPENRIQQHRNIIQAASANGVKKIVYTSIIGADGDSSFDPIVQSNRQTEKDIQASGMDWSIGRNGLYIEPDVEYIDQYKKDGKITNCAGEGLCSYTTRDELAFAYSQMILNEGGNSKIFHLCGEAISQKQLCIYLNQVFNTELKFENMSSEDYLDFQIEHNGDYLGPIIAGIYEKIRKGEFQMSSDYEAASGRPHISWNDYFSSL